MRIKSKVGVSIREQLETILKGTLPMVRDTGMTNHLRAIHSPKYLKGKAVNFCYRKRDMKITENLVVSEYTFGVYNRRAMSQNADTAHVQSLVREMYNRVND